jgi:hypothetical protein
MSAWSLEDLIVRDVLVQGAEPLVLGVEGHLEVADGRHVVLACLMGEVLADLVADVVLVQHREVDVDARLLGEVVRGELLQLGHLSAGCSP